MTSWPITLYIILLRKKKRRKSAWRSKGGVSEVIHHPMSTYSEVSAGPWLALHSFAVAAGVSVQPAAGIDRPAGGS